MSNLQSNLQLPTEVLTQLRADTGATEQVLLKLHQNLIQSKILCRKFIPVLYCTTRKTGKPEGLV